MEILRKGVGANDNIRLGAYLSILSGHLFMESLLGSLGLGMVFSDKQVHMKHGTPDLPGFSPSEKLQDFSKKPCKLIHQGLEPATLMTLRRTYAASSITAINATPKGLRSKLFPMTPTKSIILLWILGLRGNRCPTVEASASSSSMVEDST